VIAPGYFQIGKAIPTTPWEMVTNATLVTKIVLGLLAVLSLLSWAVMLGKWLEFRRVRRAGDAFMRSFDRAQSLDEVSTLAKHAVGERPTLARRVSEPASDCRVLYVARSEAIASSSKEWTSPARDSETCPA